MKNALKLFKTDLKRVAKTPAVWVILAGLAILPSFYAWFNLWAMWDPYSNTGHIKVAVVNEDQGDKVRGRKINVGNTLEDNLKKNDKFDWQFVSREKADHEIKMGKYYAGIYIPKSFSHHITGTLRKKPQQADIEYKVNQKINAVAPKMTDTGSTVIVDEANKQFNETVTKTLLQEANKVGLQIEDEVPTINKIKNAVYAAHDSLPKINKIADRIVYLNEHQDQLDEYANKFRALGNYKGDILDAQQKLNDVNAAVPSLNEKAKLILALDAYMPKVEKLLDVASNDIPAQFPKLNRGVDIASEGLDLANTRLNDAQGYLTQAQQRVGDYQEVANRAQEVNGQANNALRQQSTASMPEYAVTPLSTDSSNDNVNDKQIVSDNDVKSMNSAFAEALLALSSNADTQAKATQSDIKALKNSTYGVLGSNRPTEFNETLRNITSRLENNAKYNQQLVDILKELENKEHVDLSSQIKEIEHANQRINETLRSTNQLTQALGNGSSGKSEAVNVLRTLPDLNNGLSDYRDFIKKDLNNRLLVVSNEITQQLNQGQNTLSRVQSKLDTINQVIRAGQDIVSTGQNRVATIQSELPALEQTYIEAMQTAQRYFPTVKQDVAKAADFVRNDLPGLEQQLANATATVNANLPTLFNKYDNAVDLLDENQPRAKEALANLANFSENRLPGIEKDLEKANKIFKKLDDDDAVDKLIDTLRNDLKKQADVIANPIHKKQTNVFPVKDYGSGMTPFYTSLSIWVGALLLVSLLSVDNKHTHLEDELTRRQVYLGKGAFFIMMGVIQTLIVTTGDLFILKAQVESPLLFVLVALFGAIIFNTIVYTSVSLLGNPGKAVAIILLVLQIAGGGGTFPVVTAPKFFQTISPFLPFTYVIDSLRETVGGIVPEILITKLIILALFGLGFFIVGVLIKPVLDPAMRKISKRIDESNVTE
ncbi:YhgE/Pip domain-containing protein [Staphylococcus devriesei]|uniref:YhgE/Pip domain-containing protein n=1 Tax=Staphylococcus devriesei TaxID=586733 RepID=A0A2T4KRJ0_9STAP|nr:YhgE/Pip domain-containing protein [Staphylococcus devriesei]PTF04976.1 YhgE/Pip domain-containing protein [Staphylococcus devriesei]PTF15902.1 YhgE/Pip domain-containing protein [Staphylococcus devriesei]PTF18546.1 YhgE/Pip domain-containing protein [Staphylococcus devriesei]RIL73346.1 YhgE/Pip domain-containing protein [Staphylococcus devriesei]